MLPWSKEFRASSALFRMNSLDVAVELVGSGRGYDVNLRPRALAVLGAVGILDHGKLAHGIHTQKLTTYTAGSVVNLRSPGELDAVQQIQILLRAPARYGKHVADHGIRCSGPACPL